MRVRVRWIPLLAAIIAAACIAQKPVGLTFTESGKGVGVYSGLVDKTATNAPATLSSMVNTIGTSVTMLEFTIKENGTKDGYPLQIKELRFTQLGTADLPDLRFVLEGPGSNNTVAATTGSTVVFKDFGDIIVSDGDTTGKTYQVKVYVRTNIQGIMADNTTIQLRASPITDFDVAETSSNILDSVITMQSNATTVTITATELQGKSSFNGISVTPGTDFPGTQIVAATDGNGRVDRDYTTDISIAAVATDCTSLPPCTLTGGGAVTPVLGISTWPSLSCATGSPPVQLKIRATSGSLTALCTAVIDIVTP